MVLVRSEIHKPQPPSNPPQAAAISTSASTSLRQLKRPKLIPLRTLPSTSATPALEVVLDFPKARDHQGPLDSPLQSRRHSPCTPNVTARRQRWGIAGLLSGHGTGYRSVLASLTMWRGRSFSLRRCRTIRPPHFTGPFTQAASNLGAPVTSPVPPGSGGGFPASRSTWRSPWTGEARCQIFTSLPKTYRTSSFLLVVVMASNRDGLQPSSFLLLAAMGATPSISNPS